MSQVVQHWKQVNAILVGVVSCYSQREYRLTGLKRRLKRCRLIRRFLGYRIPARAIMDVPLREVDYGEGHQLADEDLFIGAETKAFIRNAELPVSTKKKIFQTVRTFYEAVLRKMFTS